MRAAALLEMAEMGGQAGSTRNCPAGVLPGQKGISVAE